jgi:cytoplasmic iron level regulating protein YaaA (DUF328/UPF0246 family)
MLVVLSPAKALDYESPLPTSRYSEPSCMAQAAELIAVLQQKTPADIASLMSLSDRLAGLNVARYAQWQPVSTVDNARPAALAFNGDVYEGLQAATFSDADWDFAQAHLRILSGLYGVLRPLDLLQPYRLEMGTRLTTPRGNSLYEFWGTHITELLQTALAAQGDTTLVNLASGEYFKSVRTGLLPGSVITPVFQDEKNGRYKIISFFAKKARGLMARYLVENRVADPEQLKAFDVAGYRYEPAGSTPTEWVFRRSEQDRNTLQL